MKKAKTTKIKESVGIDIGSHSVKAVHLKKLHEGFRLLNCEIRPTVPIGVEYVPSDLRPDRFAPVIVEIMKAMHINPKKIQHLVTSVGGTTPASSRSRPSFCLMTNWNPPCSSKRRNTFPSAARTWSWISR